MALNHYLVEKATVRTFFYFLKFYTDISPKYKPVIKMEPYVLPMNMQIPTHFGLAIAQPTLGSHKSLLTWYCNSFLGFKPYFNMTDTERELTFQQKLTIAASLHSIKYSQLKNTASIHQIQCKNSNQEVVKDHQIPLLGSLPHA